MKIHCPHCTQHILLEPKYYGTTISCPTCQGGIIIPSETKKQSDSVGNTWIWTSILAAASLLGGIPQYREPSTRQAGIIIIGCSIVFGVLAYFVYRRSRIAIAGLIVLISVNMIASLMDGKTAIVAIDAMIIFAYIKAAITIFKYHQRIRIQSVQEAAIVLQ